MNKPLLPQITFKNIIADGKRVETAYARIFEIARRNILSKRLLTNSLSQKYTDIQDKYTSMSDDNAIETNKSEVGVGMSLGADHFATEELLKPHEAFNKYAMGLVPVDAGSSERIASLQEAGRRFNESAPEARKIELLYHFTDSKGAIGITEQGSVGRETDSRLYLTSLSPDVAQPLASAEDARGFELYFKEHKAPQTLREHMERFVLGMKFKWSHDVQKRMLHKPIVPVGADKLENVVLLAVARNSTLLKRDEQGEIYVERLIKTQADPDFSVFGPFSIPEKTSKK